MDMSKSIEPRSDQKNSDDFIGGAQTFTVERVEAGSAEQPVNVHLVESPGKPYKPSKSMRRVLVAGWGKEASAYAGRSLTLYRNPDIKFGGATVGGIEISHMSHLDKSLSVPLTVTRGKKKNHTVQPLAAPQSPAQPGPPTVPADVLANVAKAIEAGTLPDYLEYATTNNAPAHILEHIKHAIKENN